MRLCKGSGLLLCHSWASAYILNWDSALLIIHKLQSFSSLRSQKSIATVNNLAFMLSTVVPFVPRPVRINLSTDLLIGPYSTQELISISTSQGHNRETRGRNYSHTLARKSDILPGITWLPCMNNSRPCDCKPSLETKPNQGGQRERAKLVGGGITSGYLLLGPWYIEGVWECRVRHSHTNVEGWEWDHSYRRDGVHRHEDTRCGVAIPWLQATNSVGRDARN